MLKICHAFKILAAYFLDANTGVAFATHIRGCVFIICKIPLFVLGINIGILVSIVKLPDEVCASHTKRVRENKKVLLHK